MADFKRVLRPELNKLLQHKFDRLAAEHARTIVQGVLFNYMGRYDPGWVSSVRLASQVQVRFEDGVLHIDFPQEVLEWLIPSTSS